jgi:choloylglycine hydrolase
MLNLNNYMHLSPKEPQNNFSEQLDFKAYSRGMGAIGLPGDLSSQSRFVRAAFTKMNSVSGSSEEESVSQFFHILNSVAMPKGCVLTERGFEYTRYSCCCNIERGIYYYTLYDDFKIKTVDMHGVDLDGFKLYISFC